MNTISATYRSRTLDLPGARPTRGTSCRSGPHPERNSAGAILLAVRDRSQYPVRKLSLRDHSSDNAAHLSPSERVALVWTLSLQAWQFKEPTFRESRLRRDIVRTLRGGR